MNKFCCLCFVLILATNLLSAKIIKSTKEGGKWGSNSTWIEKEIPTDKDTVIISGNVECITNFICENIVIEKEGNLILNTYADNVNIINNVFTIYGCFHNSPTSILKINGKILKESDCFINLGTLEIDNHTPDK